MLARLARRVRAVAVRRVAPRIGTAGAAAARAVAVALPRRSFAASAVAKAAKAPAAAAAAKPAAASAAHRNLILSVETPEDINRANITTFEGKEKMDLTPEEYINAVPPIEVDSDKVMCDGGHEGLGHPAEFIQLNKVRPDVPETCKYCGLRYVQKPHH